MIERSGILLWLWSIKWADADASKGRKMICASNLEKVLKTARATTKTTDTLRQKVAYTADKTDTVESIVDTGFYYTKKEMRQSLWNMRDYLCMVVIILAIVQGILFLGA